MHKRPEKGGQKKVSDMVEPGLQVVKSLLIQLLEINLGPFARTVLTFNRGHLSSP